MDVLSWRCSGFSLRLSISLHICLQWNGIMFVVATARGAAIAGPEEWKRIATACRHKGLVAIADWRGLCLGARFPEMLGGRKNKNNNPQNGFNSSTTSRIHMSIERKCWTKTDLFVYFSFHFHFYYYFYEFKFHNKCRVWFGFHRMAMAGAFSQEIRNSFVENVV